MLKDRLKDMMKGYVVIEYRWVVLTKIVASCLAVTLTLALAGMATGPANQVNAAPSLTVSAPPADEGKSFKGRILRWMRDRSEMPEQVLSSIYDAAVKNSNPDVILAICVVESEFNPLAKSRKGAMGLMGVMPRVWLEELKAQGLVKEKRELYLIASNIASGAYVFEKYLSGTNNIEKALFQYVGGDPSYAGRVLQALGEIYLARIQN